MGDRTLTDEDVEAIVEGIKKHRHPIFGVPDDEFSKVWPNMRSLSDGMDTTKKTTTRVIVGGFVIAVGSALLLGLKVAIVNFYGTLPK